MSFKPAAATKSQTAANAGEKKYKESDGVAYFSTTKDGKRDYIRVILKDGKELYLNPSKGVTLTVDNNAKSAPTNPDFSVAYKVAKN
jgi:hypothetical protein